MGLKNAKVASTRLGQIKKQMRLNGEDLGAPTSDPTTASPTVNKTPSKEKKTTSPSKPSTSAGVKKSTVVGSGKKRGRKPKYLKLENPEIKKEAEDVRNGNLRTPVSDDDDGVEGSEYESIRVTMEESMPYDE